MLVRLLNLLGGEAEPAPRNLSQWYLCLAGLLSVMSQILRIPAVEEFMVKKETWENGHMVRKHKGWG